MVKPATRASSRYSRDALLLLGKLIRRSRIERGMTIEELAERTGVSRGLVRRMEAGDPGCSIGTVFEAAAIVGIRLFDADHDALGARLAETSRMLTLLPMRVRTATRVIEDDF